MKISCVMITAHRDRFVVSAVKCFLAQTWANRELVIYENAGNHQTCERIVEDLTQSHPWARGMIRIYHHRGIEERSIGYLRNCANDLAGGDAIAHWDDDDWSHAMRLQQAAQALETGAPAFGYHSMLFADMRKPRTPGWWVYRSDVDNYAVGASLVYRKDVWREKPFEDRNLGEDNHFIQDLPVVTADGVWIPGVDGIRFKPRMVARMHPESTSRARPFAGDLWSPLEQPELIERARELVIETAGEFADV